MNLKTATVAASLVLVAIPAMADPVNTKPLTAQELAQARRCAKNLPCPLPCNRVHDAGRDDLVRKGACAE